MKRKSALSNKNASDATETDASELSKKARPSHQSQSGDADQEPPPKTVAVRNEPEKKDVEMTRGDARPTQVVDVKIEPVGAPARAAEPLARAAEPARRDSESVKREAPPSAGYICVLQSNGDVYYRIPLDATVTFGLSLIHI